VSAPNAPFGSSMINLWRWENAKSCLINAVHNSNIGCEDKAEIIEIIEEYSKLSGEPLVLEGKKRYFIEVLIERAASLPDVHRGCEAKVCYNSLKEVPMPKYKIGDKVFRRKHLYMPCILHESFPQLPEEEQAKLLKSTYWADNITEREWDLLLNRSIPYKEVVRSRLKRKAVGWLVALARISYFDPILYGEILSGAEETYREQIGVPIPIIKKEE